MAFPRSELGRDATAPARREGCAPASRYWRWWALTRCGRACYGYATAGIGIGGETVDGQASRWLAVTVATLAGAGFVAPSATAAPPPSVVAREQRSVPNPESQHRTEVEPDSFATRNQVVTAFQVGRMFDGGATNIGWATSNNNGNRFASGFLPGITKAAGGTYARASDPSVAYDAAHGVWLISSLALGEPVRGLAVVVNRSRDGLGWSRPSTVALASGGATSTRTGRPATTPASPFYGHCYTEFDDVADADRIKMSTSTDGGVTWSAPANTAGNDLASAVSRSSSPTGR